MPLSEHEKRQLEQIEQALRAGDPRFAGAVHAADPRVHYKRRVIVAVLGFVIGVALLLAGVVVNVILIAVAGFVVMLACSMWAVGSYRRMTGRAPGRDDHTHGHRRTGAVRGGLEPLRPRPAVSQASDGGHTAKMLIRAHWIVSEGDRPHCPTGSAAGNRRCLPMTCAGG
jgi:Protein of unknown function (DUF3040)